MKAVGLTRYLPIDDPASLLDVELPDPAPTGRDLLVEVRAVAVNPVDYKVRSPKDQVEPAPRVLGWDAAGVVKAVGGEVTLFSPGDEVYYAGSIARPGCDSELHLVDERIVGRKPRTLGFAEAAALPLTTVTAWEGLFDRLGVSRTGAHRGASLLLIGGAGGVGSIAIQLAKQLAGLRVIATASRPESTRWARELGADDIIDHTRPLDAQLRELGVPEVDYLMCLATPDPYVPAFAPILKPQAKICLIVEPKGPLPIGTLMRKSITIAWEIIFTRPLFQTPDMIEQHAILGAAADLVERGVIRTTLAQHLGKINAENLRRAHRTLEQGHSTGKLVLEGF